MSGQETSQAADTAGVWIHPPAVYLLAVVLGIALQRLWPLGFAWGGSLRIALGLAVLCGGVAILGSAFSVFRRIGQHPDPRKPTPEIARDGPYRFSRNPMYLAGCLIQLGLGIALANAWIVLLAVPVALLIHYRAVLPEERYLEGKFGEEYARFKASVRRWI